MMIKIHDTLITYPTVLGSTAPGEKKHTKNKNKDVYEDTYMIMNKSTNTNDSVLH